MPLPQIKISERAKKKLEQYKKEFQAKSFSDTIQLLVLEYEKLKLQCEKFKEKKL